MSVQRPAATASVFFNADTVAEAEFCLDDLVIMKPKPTQQTANMPKDVHWFVPTFVRGLTRNSITQFGHFYTSVLSNY